MDQFTTQMKEFFNNKYVMGFIFVGTILYASLIKPELPQGVIKLFDYAIVKMIMYALIVLLMTQNLQVAIIVAVGFYVLMNVLSEQKITETFIAKTEK
jgi:hypothetical protein